MYCVECGTRNPDDAKFCKQCGRRMEPLDPERAPAAQQEPVVAPSLAPHDPEARYKELLALAFRHYDNAEYDAAMIACKGALELKPDSTDGHALLSTIYERQGDRDQAIAEREKVLALNPASIADREKLEALRSGIAQVAPRKILSARRPEPTFWDTPAGAAAAAVAVTLVVVIVGYAFSVYRDRTARDAPPIQPGTVASSGLQQPAQQNPTPAMSGQPGAVSPQSQQPPVQNPQPPPTASQQPAAGVLTPGGMEPLPIRPSPPPLGDNNARTGQGAQDGGFFDPGRDNRSGTGSGAAGAETQPTPQPNPGRIEIVVSPQGGGGGGGAPAPPSNPPAGGANTDSRYHAALAMDLQLKGDYRRAAQSWERALEGAGDDRPGIHQKAALCYQRTGDMANARRHYNEAIKGYRDQVAAGRNVEAATQAIKACEAGLAASR